MWLKLDDGTDEHPKFTRYGRDYDACFVTWVRLCLFCARNSTDGVVPYMKEREFDPRIIELLLLPFKDGSGPLKRNGEGELEVHDFLDYNPSRKQVEAERKKGKERVTKHRQNKRNGVTPPVTDPVTNGECNGVRSGAPYPNPVPGSNPVFESQTDSKTSPCRSNEIPDDVLGYFIDKIGRDPDDKELRSLTTLCRNYPSGVVTLAIGQACAQGELPNNFALVTVIAKKEATPA